MEIIDLNNLITKYRYLLEKQDFLINKITTNTREIYILTNILKQFCSLLKEQNDLILLLKKQKETNQIVNLLLAIYDNTKDDKVNGIKTIRNVFNTTLTDSKTLWELSKWVVTSES